MTRVKPSLCFILALVFLACCRKDEDDNANPCYAPWSKLEDARNPVLLPEGTWWHPRILGNRIWYSSSKNIAGVSWEDGSAMVVPRPQGMNIHNPDQRDVSFAGTDRASIFYFDWQNLTWKTLYTATQGSAIDHDIDLEIMEGLLPFVQKNTTDNSQRIWIYAFAADQAYEVTKFSELYEQYPYKIYTQPKVFVDGNDTLLATVVQFDTESTRSVLVFSLKKGKFTENLSLDYGDYRETIRVRQNLIVASYSFTGGFAQAVNPVHGKVLWKDPVCQLKEFEGDLFKVFDCFFGSKVKVDIQTGNSDYFLPWDIDINSIGGLMEGNYCFAGREKSNMYAGPLNHIVFVNREKGCEVKRLPLPGLSSAFDKLTCLPDSNWIITQDEQRYVHFLKLR